MIIRYKFKHPLAGSTLGHGSNPAHGDAKRMSAATKCAEVFALPFLGIAGAAEL
jgi:hypothetical protein